MQKKRQRSPKRSPEHGKLLQFQQLGRQEILEIYQTDTNIQKYIYILLVFVWRIQPPEGHSSTCTARNPDHRDSGLGQAKLYVWPCVLVCLFKCIYLVYSLLRSVWRRLRFSLTRGTKRYQAAVSVLLSSKETSSPVLALATLFRGRRQHRRQCMRFEARN